MLTILIGCIPAIIIRIIVQKPLSYVVSIFISIGIFLVTVASQLISPALAGAIPLLSFFILIHKSKNEKSKSAFYKYDHSAVDTTCKYCHSVVKISQDELKNKKFICPKCYEENNMDKKFEKSVINTKIELEKRRTEITKERINENRVVKKVILFFSLIGFVIGMLLYIILYGWDSNVYLFALMFAGFGFIISTIAGNLIKKSRKS